MKTGGKYKMAQHRDEKGSRAFKSSETVGWWQRRPEAGIAEIGKRETNTATMKFGH